jgi:hypothetical protein
MNDPALASQQDLGAAAPLPLSKLEENVIDYD